LTTADQAVIEELEASEPDANRRGAAIGRLMTHVYGDDAENDVEGVIFDATAHEETWVDMVRLQVEGIYPAAFAAISVPVLMLHGDTDPHPGRSICDALQRHTPQLEYQELPKCGHSPWLEREARKDFFETLGTWLALRFVGTYPQAG
jgi:pimeloyl-ACP methyl ester carboxylesterase